MALKDITSEQAVLEAAAEYDRVGPKAFFEKYGGKPSKGYWLIIDGREYPSKAIAFAAHGYQFPEEGALRPELVHKGGKPVQRTLELLGFEVRVS